MTAALLTVAGCSSEPASAPAPEPLVLADTYWIGACDGLETGTYTLRFGPRTDSADTVTVGFPSARPDASVEYVVTEPETGPELLVKLDTPWQGPAQRDQENLTWRFEVGDPPAPARCRLTQAEPPFG